MISFVVCRNYDTFASIIKSCRPIYIYNKVEGINKKKENIN